MTKRWYSSDFHIGHRLVAGIRGFGSVENPDTDAHDAYLAEQWDRVVAPDDTVYVLGDIAINPKRGAFAWFRERPGKKILIAGNHDEVAGFRSKGLNARMRPEWSDTFAAISDFAFLKIGGRRVALSHYPYEGEGDRDIPDRMSEVRLRDEGLPLLHGHTHARHMAHMSASGTPMFHVGLDAWGLNLVPESSIVEWLDYTPEEGRHE